MRNINECMIAENHQSQPEKCIDGSGHFPQFVMELFVQTQLMKKGSFNVIKHQIRSSIAIIQINVFYEQPSEKTVQVDDKQSMRNDVNNDFLQKNCTQLPAEMCAHWINI